jgi:NAD(P)-dependent dehydrogenase (short-subunit alcohol dehydrogenase family)
MSQPCLSSLAGRVAVITGAGSGIGKATAMLLAERAVRVAAADINLARVTTFVSDINAEGGEAVALQADVSHDHDVGLVPAVAVWRRRFGQAPRVTRLAQPELSARRAATS